MALAAWYLIQGAGLGLAAAAQPGPFQAYVISHTLDVGWRRASPVSLAPLITDGPIILLALIVLRQIPGWFEPGLCLASGLFILYLAWQAFTRWREGEANGPARPAGIRSLGQAVMINLLNPNPYIYWSLVTGPILLDGWRNAPLHGIVFLLGFYGAMVSILLVIIVFFGLARQRGPRLRRLLLGLSAMTLAGFGAWQLYRGIACWPREVLT
ncbi:MAG TPA: LysE family transporter [bacterium]|nr:LysE family transporter [Candidatus Omnitrophota bacterium]HOJ58668.1 LysE family transporter [bacterium]HOL95275.1 LysE family transporter [bacterium]HPP00283.1 LysE family transporter [bacterium]HXK92425.1 LysE family transporter [bacterium]